MHIPENYLSPSTCAVMTAAMLPVWGYSINKVRTEIPKARMPLLGIGAAFSFLGMMFNVPLPGGTTGHAVGGTLIAILTGSPAVVSSESLKTTQTTIPFVKNNEFDYGWLTGGNSVATWILYVLVAIFVVTAVSNGANLTDGLDGLATGVSVPIVAVLGVLAYLSGHIVYADYLNIMYIPGSGEMVVFAAALVGALVGFLWYNSFPAQIFMGDTGSLAIGGVIAVFALCIRKELLLPLLCGVFLVESFSVMMQVGWFKYTKRRYGEGRRILLMSPVHHHYQKKGIFETKIVLRFWIISLLLAAITLVTLKIR